MRAAPDGPVLGTVDRGALPVLGIEAVGVHLNGLVERADGLHCGWPPRDGQAARPGQAGPHRRRRRAGRAGPAETLVKEAAEEAGLPAALAAQARTRGVISYAMDRPEGLRRDRLHCYDLMLPDDFEPHPVDGEVAGFELWPIARVIDAVRDTDEFKFNVNLVLIDLFLRLGVVADPTLAERLHGGAIQPAGQLSG